MAPDHGVLHVEPSESRVVRLPDGREFADVQLVVTPEALDRLFKGYQCAYCLEVFDNANPSKCPVCSFPVAKEQTEYLRSRYLGKKKVGSRVSLADEFARMREMRDYEDRTGIELPDSVKFPNGVV